MSKIAINRPGAIGDIVMISNCLPKLREKYDFIDFFCHSSVAGVLGKFLQNNQLVDRIGYSENLDSYLGSNSYE